jgi:hypothetical protein
MTTKNRRGSLEPLEPRRIVDEDLPSDRRIRRGLGAWSSTFNDRHDSNDCACHGSTTTVTKDTKARTRSTGLRVTMKASKNKPHLFFPAACSCWLSLLREPLQRPACFAGRPSRTGSLTLMIFVIFVSALGFVVFVNFVVSWFAFDK